MVPDGASCAGRLSQMRDGPTAATGRTLTPEERKKAAGKGTEKTKKLQVHSGRAGPAGKTVPVSLQLLWQAEKLPGADQGSCRAVSIAETVRWAIEFQAKGRPL